MIDVAVLVPFIVASAVVILVPGADSFLLLRLSVIGGAKAGFRGMAGIELGNSIQAALMISGIGLFVSRAPHAILILKIFGTAYLLYLAAMSAIAFMRHYRIHRIAGSVAGDAAKGVEGGDTATRAAATRNPIPDTALSADTAVPAETVPAADTAVPTDTVPTTDTALSTETAPVAGAVAAAETAVPTDIVRRSDPARPSVRGPGRGRAGLPAFWQGFLSNITNPKVLLFFVAFVPQFLGTASNTSLQLLLLSGIFVVFATLWGLVIVLAAARLRETMSSPRFARAMDLTCAIAFTVLAAALWVV